MNHRKAECITIINRYIFSSMSVEISIANDFDGTLCSMLLMICMKKRSVRNVT